MVEKKLMIGLPPQFLLRSEKAARRRCRVAVGMTALMPQLVAHQDHRQLRQLSCCNDALDFRSWPLAVVDGGYMLQVFTVQD